MSTTLIARAAAIVAGSAAVAMFTAGPALADSSGATTACPATSSGTKPVCRLAGGDRVATAASISKQEFPQDGSAKAVILTAAYDFPDAMTAGPLGKLYSAPVLLTAPGALSSTTLSEIRRVLPPPPSGTNGTATTGCATSGPSQPAAATDTVYVIGGYGAIAQAVDQQLEQNGYNVVRIAGRDRFATSVAVADCEGDPNTVFLATGDIFADALSAGPAATEKQGTVLLTNRGTMPPSVDAYLQARANPTVWAVGQAAVNAAKSANVNAQPIVGGDRFATSALVASDFFPTPALVGVATGYNFPDALAGGAFMGVENGPVLLTSPDSLASAAGTYLGQQHASITGAFLFGGTGSLSERVADQVSQVINQS
jgi:putative cell wall-binding protein